MKKIIQYTVSLSVTLQSFAAMSQSFTVTGPRTVWNLPFASSPAGVSFAADNIKDPLTGTGQYFTLFNFETGKIVPSSQWANPQDWHIGFQAQNENVVTRIILNSGGSGNGNVQGFVNFGLSFENYTSVPGSAVFTVDGITNAEKVTSWNSATRLSYYNSSGNTIPGWVPGSIYGTSTVTPYANRLLILHLPSGQYVKFELISNYKNAPLSVPVVTSDVIQDYGFASFRYLVSRSADLSENITKVTSLNVSLASNQFFNLGAADTVTVADSASVKWDLGFKKTTILLNGGTSGPGTTSGKVFLTGFNDLVSIDGATLATDNTGKAIATGSDNGWYHYDFPTHSISAIAGRSIGVKTSYGRYAKILVQNYYKGNPNLNCGPSGYYTFSYYFNPYGLDYVNKTFTIPAAPATPILNIASASTAIKAGETIPLTITSNFAWTLSSPTFATLGTLSGVNSKLVNATFAPNAGLPRTAEISVSGCDLLLTKSILQAGIDFLTITGLSAPTTVAGNIVFNATISSNINWTITGSSWLTVNSLSGSNGAVIRVSYPLNTTTGVWAAGFTVSGGGLSDMYQFSVTGTGVIIINPTITGINGALDASEVSIYPNPATEKVTISSLKDITAVQLVNNVGQVVADKKVASKSASIDLAGIEPGTYVVRIQLKNTVVTKRLVVN